MKEHQKYGFTLLEVLVVFIIISLLLVITIPAVNNALRSQEESRYNYHDKIIKEASRTYYDQFPDNFESESATCYNVSYDQLIVNGLIKEDVISCDEKLDTNLGGVLQFTKNGNHLEIDSFLNCQNTSTGEMVSEKKNSEAKKTCEDENKFFFVDGLIVKYDNASGSNYDTTIYPAEVPKNWTNRNLYFEINVNDPYMVGFDHFEYSLDKGSNWKKLTGVKHDIVSTSTIGTIQVKATDKAGNKTGVIEKTFAIDKEPPTCSTTGGSTTWTNGNRTLTGTCSDVLSGCSPNTVTKLFNVNMNGSQSPGSVSDAAGNTTVCPTNTVRIDKTAPTCATTGGSTTWTNGSRTLTGTCTDTGGSGCVGNVSKSFTTQINSTAQTPGTIYDVAGNSTVCPNTTVRIDKTAPTCATTGGSTTWTNGNRTLTGTCTDTGGSGCKAATVTASHTTNTNGSYSPGVVEDNAGNKTTCSSTTVRIDKTAPTCATTGGSTTWTNGNRTLTGTCSDTGGSGCTGNITKAFTANTNSAQSPGVVYDGAGNSATCPTNTVRIDKTAPTCATTGGSASWTNGNRTLTGTCTDTGGSGCKTATVTTTHTVNRNGSYSPGSISDNAGNTATCPTNTVRIDKTAPTCTTSGGSIYWTTASRTITGTCADTGGSGCAGNAGPLTYSTSVSGYYRPGSVSDNAGNTTTCPTTAVHVDRTTPYNLTGTCSVALYLEQNTTHITVDLSASTFSGMDKGASTYYAEGATRRPNAVWSVSGTSKYYPNTSGRTAINLSSIKIVTNSGRSGTFGSLTLWCQATTYAT